MSIPPCLGAALAALLAPMAAFSQPVKVLPVEVGNLGGVNTSGAGARSTTLGQNSAPGYMGPNNISLTGPSIASPRVVVAGANPAAAAAAAADPRVALGPAAAFTGQASPQARGVAVSASREALPGALPAAEDPARRTPEGSGGFSAIDSAVKDLDRAKKDEKNGMSGAVGVRLDALFDFSRGRSGEILPADGPAQAAARYGAAVQGLPDPKVIGVEPALSKVRSFARAAEAAEAPALYGRAVEIAREGLPAGEAASRIASIKAEAAARAPAAVQTLAEKALAAAAAGRTTDAARYAKGVDGWDALLSGPGLPYVENLRDLTGTVKHVLKGALETPGRAAAAPGVRFEAVKAGGKTAALRVKFKFAKDTDAPLSVVPQTLAAAFALPELAGFVALEGPAAPEGPGLAAAFALRPRAGFSSLYRSAVAQGRSSWSSFWVAARGLSVSAALTLWDEVKAFLVRALQALGILRAAAPSGPVVEAPSPEALADLRLLMAERAERPAPPAVAPDALGLGYRVVSGR